MAGGEPRRFVGQRAEPGLVEWAYANDVPLVATNDVYYAKAAQAKSHDALLCIADGAFTGQEDRRRITGQHWFKPAAVMRELFADLPEACDNTIDIARRCAFLVNTHAPILPRFDTGAGRSEADELAHQAREGLKVRLTEVTPAVPEEEYWTRLEWEVGIITQMGFPGYFLIVSDFIKWAKTHGIPVGPGRGSGAGSLVAYSLTITDLDPLQRELTGRLAGPMRQFHGMPRSASEIGSNARLSSSTTTRAPFDAASTAAQPPAMPKPITTTSTSSLNPVTVPRGRVSGICVPSAMRTE